MSENPAITDSHCHLDFPDFDGQQAQIIENALAAGVTQFTIYLTNGSEEQIVADYGEHVIPHFT